MPRHKYVNIPGVIGELYLANPNEFAPVKMSRCERAENINKVFDKIAKFLNEVP